MIWDSSFQKRLEETVLHKNGLASDLVPPQVRPAKAVIYLPVIHSGCVRPVPRLSSLPHASIASRCSSQGTPQVPAKPPHCISAEPTRVPSSAALPSDHLQTSRDLRREERWACCYIVLAHDSIPWGRLSPPLPPFPSFPTDICKNISLISRLLK